MGRRPVLTPKALASVKDAIRQGGTDQAIARRHGVSRSTVQRVRKHLIARAEHELAIAGFWDELRGLAWEGRIEWDVVSALTALVVVMTQPKDVA